MLRIVVGSLVLLGCQIFLMLNIHLFYEFLLTHLDVTINTSFRIHVFYLPLTFQMQLTCLVGIHIWSGIILHLIVICMFISYWGSILLFLRLIIIFRNTLLISISEIFLNALFGKFIVAVLVFTHVIYIEEKMVTLSVY